MPDKQEKKLNIILKNNNQKGCPLDKLDYTSQHALQRKFTYYNNSDIVLSDYL